MLSRCNIQLNWPKFSECFTLEIRIHGLSFNLDYAAKIFGTQLVDIARNFGNFLTDAILLSKPAALDGHLKSGILRLFSLRIQNTCIEQRFAASILHLIVLNILSHALSLEPKSIIAFAPLSYLIWRRQGLLIANMLSTSPLVLWLQYLRNHLRCVLHFLPIFVVAEQIHSYMYNNSKTYKLIL